MLVFNPESGGFNTFYSAFPVIPQRFDFAVVPLALVLLIRSASNLIVTSKKEIMKGLLTSLITVLTFTGLQAQSLPAAPKLVVGLTIDQLRTDYLEAFFVTLR